MADPVLRKAALEASGCYAVATRPLSDGSWLVRHELGGGCYSCRDFRSRVDALQSLPAVESDPGAFWPWFLQWISEREANFVLCDWFSDVQQTIRVFEMELMFKDGGKIQKQGVTVEEAGCKAVIAAAKRKEQA